VPLLEEISLKWELRRKLLKKSALMPLFKSKQRWTKHYYNEILVNIPIVEKYFVDLKPMPR